MIYYHFKIYCETEQSWKTVIKTENIPPVTCPEDASHEVNPDSVAIDKTVDTNLQQVEVTSTPAFAAKTLGDKSLFKRVVGKTFDVVPGDNSLIYTLTFPWAKFMALEIINGEIGDTVSLYVLDTATGTFSGFPNAPLNQFGFEANIAKEFYCHKSEFDADVYQGLQIKIVYTTATAKKIGVNYVMNEVK